MYLCDVSLKDCGRLKVHQFFMTGHMYVINTFIVYISFQGILQGIHCRMCQLYTSVLLQQSTLVSTCGINAMRKIV